MNFFELLVKQMRQRALSTWLTTFSVLLGVGLAIAIMTLQREAQSLFAQTDFGYDLIVGPKGSSLQLVMNTVYHVQQSEGNIPYEMYARLLGADPELKADVKIAIPYAVGDTYQGERIVGTSVKIFGKSESVEDLPESETFNYRVGKRFELSDGRFFEPDKFEAVIGSRVAEEKGVKIGDKFHPVHDASEGGPPHVHNETWTVVGILKPTQTASDSIIYVSLISYLSIPDHQEGMEKQDAIRMHQTDARSVEVITDELEQRRLRNAFIAREAHKANPATLPTTHLSEVGDSSDHYEVDKDGHINTFLPKDEWLLSAILVKARGQGLSAQKLIYDFKASGEGVMAVSPPQVMYDFFHDVLRNLTLLLLAIAVLVTVVAAVGILVSIYNSVAARNREIAILRALGATRMRILGNICAEAGVIGLAGSILGLVVGHGICGVVSAIFVQKLGTGINWVVPSWGELLYLVGVVGLAVVAGLAPALKAYRTPVATNLVAE